MKPRIIYLLLIIVTKGFTGNLYGQAATSVTMGGSTSVNTIPNNVATVVDDAVTVTANGNITGFTISITGSYTTGDILNYAGSLPSGISAAAFNTATRSLVFSGTTSPANWQTLLRTVRLQTTSAVCNPESRKVTFVVGNKYYNPVNGHFYEYYSSGLSWTSAKSFSSGLSYFGREGYLTTITSAAENSFIIAFVGQNSWMGCSDNYDVVNTAVGYTLFANQAAADGKFYWVAGPESGTKMCNQNAWAAGGIQAQSGVYNNWQGGEPNDYPGQTSASPGEEDYGHVYSGSGLWNDYPNGQSIGSIIEYGAMPNDNTSSQVIHTRDININGAPSGTVTGGNVSVCSGTNSTTLTLTGLTGSVVRWEYSTNDFLTAGTTISNTTTSNTVTNISTTTYYRAIVNTTSGCNSLATSSTPVYVLNNVAGNVFANNNTICAGSSVTFTLSGNEGSVQKWQVSTNIGFASSVTDINNTTTTLDYTLGSNGTYYFRAVVQNGSCGSPVNTSGYTINVVTGTSPVGGTVSNTEHCSGSSNSGTLTLSGSTGSVTKWQYSVDGGVVWTDVANTTTTLNYSGVGTTRIYRARVINGSCGSVYSATGTVYVYGTTVSRWDGGVSSAWQNASNWCGGIADNGIDVVISSSASNQLVLDQNRTIGSLNFNGSGRYVDIGNYILTAVSVSNYNSTSYIKTTGNGALKMSIPNLATKIYPVGNSAYNPGSITNLTGSGDYISIRVLDEVFDNGLSGYTSSTARVKRTWDISKTNANSGLGLTMIFYWNTGETFNLLTPALYHYENNTWTKQNGVTINALNMLTYVAYTGTFSPFAVGNSVTPLPVKLISFEAVKDIVQHKVQLNWVAGSEEAHTNHVLERSKDGKIWETLINKESQFTNDVVTHYGYTDVHPMALNFYRLKIISPEGNISYSEVKKVDFTVPATMSARLFPNPCHTFTELITTEPVRYTISDIDGRVLQEGICEGSLRISDLTSGVYLVNLIFDDQIQVLKLVVE